jgi:hypothetical protein
LYTTNEPRIAILVLGCLLDVYDRCIKVLRSTWGSRSVPDVDIFYVYGGLVANPGRPDMLPIEQLIGQPAPTLQDGQAWVLGDVILCGAGDVREDQADGILRKRLIAFGYLAKHRAYDFIYTVCAASYVDIDALGRYVRTIPRRGVYHGGLNVDAETGYPFVSGASFLISRDVATHLADNAATILAGYPDTLPDDVAIGHFIARTLTGLPPAEIARRIEAGLRATDNETFVVPNVGQASLDFVTAPASQQAPRDNVYHFHFHTHRMWEMEDFHHGFFSTTTRPAS